MLISSARNEFLSSLSCDIKGNTVLKLAVKRKNKNKQMGEENTVTSWEFAFSK